MIENNSVSFRPMREDDLDSVMVIDRLSFSLPWPENSYYHDLERNPDALLWVAEINSPDNGSKVVGVIDIWLILDEAHIATLAVHPDYRGRRIGARLLIKVLEEAVNRGASRAMLEVRASNQIAQALYKNYGFEIVNRRQRYYRDNNEDALLMNLDNLDDLIKRENEKQRVIDRI
jgi:ribosomal-protein-alanine N-acetyltransferase